MRKSARSGLVVCLLGLLVLQGCIGASHRSRASGPDQRQIAAALARYEDSVGDFDQVRAIVVAWHDQVVFQRYVESGPQTYWDVESVTKSVVSTLVGIALAEGRIKSLDQTVATLLPQHAADMSPAVAGTTLRQLLTMTGGFPSGTAAGGPAFSHAPDWVADILRHPASPPGDDFVYSNAGAHLVSAILQRATGMSALAYARSRLFGPLDIPTHPAMHGVASLSRLGVWSSAGFAWPRDPQGVSTGWWGLKLRPLDLLELGELYLAKGRWHGRQVVPASWVEAATSAQVDASSSPVDAGEGYGYLWWTGHADGSWTYTAAGFGGQLIEVVPDRDLVVVTATEVRLDDPTSHGIDLDVLQTAVNDAIVSQFPQR